MPPEMFHQAIRRKVAYILGGVFSVDGNTRNAVRLNLGKEEPDTIREGVRRLAEVTRSALNAAGTA